MNITQDYGEPLEVTIHVDSRADGHHVVFTAPGRDDMDAGRFDSPNTAAAMAASLTLFSLALDVYVRASKRVRALWRRS